MISAAQGLRDFKDANKVVVDTQFYEFDTEHYEKNILAERPWRKK